MKSVRAVLFNMDWMTTSMKTRKQLLQSGERSGSSRDILGFQILEDHPITGILLSN